MWQHSILPLRGNLLSKSASSFILWRELSRVGRSFAPCVQSLRLPSSNFPRFHSDACGSNAVAPQKSKKFPDGPDLKHFLQEHAKQEGGEAQEDAAREVYSPAPYLADTLPGAGRYTNL